MKNKKQNFLFSLLLFPDKCLAKLFISFIKIYQKTISPDHSHLGKTNPLSGCKFYPSCSNYSISVLERTGFVLGIWKIIWRILRCNPFSKGGIDFPYKE